MAHPSGARILVVDDEQPIRRALRTYLSKCGFRISEAETATQAINLFDRFKPDLVILDLGLPDIDGIQVIAMLRARSSTPIIVLSVNDSDEAKVSALELGADDYLTKPFSIRELHARVQVALRHVSAPSTSPIFRTGELEVDLEHRRVRLANKEVELSPTEYALLKILVAHPNRIQTFEQLSKEVWGPEHSNESHYLHVYIARLRKKLEADPQMPRYLVNDPGVGYRLLTQEPFVAD